MSFSIWAIYNAAPAATGNQKPIAIGKSLIPLVSLAGDWSKDGETWRQKAESFTRNIVLSLAAKHFCADVKIVLLSEPSDAAALSFPRFPLSALRLIKMLVPRLQREYNLLVPEDIDIQTLRRLLETAFGNWRKSRTNYARSPDLSDAVRTGPFPLIKSSNVAGMRTAGRRASGSFITQPPTRTGVLRNPSQKFRGNIDSAAESAYTIQYDKIRAILNKGA